MHHYYSFGNGTSTLEYVVSMYNANVKVLKIATEGSVNSLYQRLVWGLKYIRDHEQLFGTTAEFARHLKIERITDGVRLVVKGGPKATPSVEVVNSIQQRLDDDEYLYDQAVQWITSGQTGGSFVKMRQRLIGDELKDKLKQLVNNHVGLDCFIKGSNVVICKKIK